MSPHVTDWRWTAPREEAASHVASDMLSDTEIATRCGITKRTLERWKLEPEFAGRVAHRVAELAAAVAALGIADRHNRVAAQNDRWHRMQTLMDARADQYKAVPGGETGLIVRQVKRRTVYYAEDGTQSSEDVEEWVLDAALLVELRKLEEHTARELGQWTEKHDHSGSVLIREYGGFDPDQV